MCIYIYIYTYISLSIYIYMYIFDWKEMAWTSSFTVAGGPGKKFRCQGPLSEDLYTDKAHYKASEPKESAGKTWDLVMEYKDGRPNDSNAVGH